MSEYIDSTRDILLCGGLLFWLSCAFFLGSGFWSKNVSEKMSPPTVGRHFFGPMSWPENGPQIQAEPETGSEADLNAPVRFPRSPLRIRDLNNCTVGEVSVLPPLWCGQLQVSRECSMIWSCSASGLVRSCLVWSGLRDRRAILVRLFGLYAARSHESVGVPRMSLVFVVSPRRLPFSLGVCLWGSTQGSIRQMVCTSYSLIAGCPQSAPRSQEACVL